jgi:uncharacterized membrane protein
MSLDTLGVILIIIGIIVVVISSLSGEGKTKFAIGGFIGPLPFGFGNDPQLMKFVIILSIVIVIALLLFFLL